jgi:hypothetical protein
MWALFYGHIFQQKLKCDFSPIECHCFRLIHSYLKIIFTQWRWKVATCKSFSVLYHQWFKLYWYHSLYLCSCRRDLIFPFYQHSIHWKKRAINCALLWPHWLVSIQFAQISYYLSFRLLVAYSKCTDTHLSIACSIVHNVWRSTVSDAFS